MLQRFLGATVRRVVDRSGSSVPEHAHDWPVLSIFVLGGYRNTTELGETEIAGPSAILYRSGAAHRNAVTGRGFEQIEVEFDPAWLGIALPDAPVSRWIAGRSGAEARTLARALAAGPPEVEVRTALRRFLNTAAREPVRAVTTWVADLRRRLDENADLSIAELAEAAGRHPSWLGTAYRRSTGEGLQETAARLRVECAASLLRETDLAPAHVAADAGFCDQSHMIRTFRRLLGRTPTAVREDRRLMRQVLRARDL